MGFSITGWSAFGDAEEEEAAPGGRNSLIRSLIFGRGPLDQPLAGPHPVLGRGSELWWGASSYSLATGSVRFDGTPESKQGLL